MKKLNLIALVLGACLLFFACSEDAVVTPDLKQATDETPALKTASKPAANLLGVMDLDFDLMATWPEEPVWVGTVTFEGYGVYGIRFFHLSEFRDFSQASPFEEYFEIYDMGDPELVYLGGPDEGVTTLANKPPDPVTYRMNGEIDQAQAPFEGWLGRHVHMSGVITWQILTMPDGTVVVAPYQAPGTLRIN